MDTGPGTQDIATTLKRRIFSVPTLLSLGIAGAFIYFLAARFDIDLASTWESIRAMDPWSYALALALYYLSFIFRGVRWRILAVNARIHDEQPARLPSVPRASQLIVVGWFVNAIAWLRLGDAYRAYAFAEDSGRSFSWSLGTVLAERVVDMATVLVMIAVGIALFSIATTAEGAVYVALFAALFMATALGALLALMKGYGAWFARLLPERLADSFTRFRQGTLGSLKQLRIVFLLGLAAWLLEAGRLYFVVQALDLSISLPLVLIVSLGHAILSTVPTPGGVGAVEPGTTTLLLLGLGKADAASVALLDRSITYLSVVVFGGMAFAAWNLRRRRQKPAIAADGGSSPQGTGRRETAG